MFARKGLQPHHRPGYCLSGRGEPGCDWLSLFFKGSVADGSALLAFGEWDQDLQQALRTSVSAARHAGKERFEATWAKMIATFETHRSLWIANFEIFTQMVSQPATREFLAGKLPMARAGLAAMFLNQEETRISEHTSKTIGTFHHVLLSGLIFQWLIDPGSALISKRSYRGPAQHGRGFAAGGKSLET